MASQPPVMEERQTTTETTRARDTAAHAANDSPAGRKPLSVVVRELRWWVLLTVGIGTGILWVAMLLQGGAIQILAGLLPVTAGIVVGRRIQQHVTWHAVLLGVVTALAAALALGVLIAVIGPAPTLLQALLFAVITLLPFPAFGVITSAKSEQRRREMREAQARRGGRLERPGRVRNIEDLRALSLPQLGGYVADLFRRHGFLINDYRFEKDRLDFQVTYEDEPWLLRVTTAEKVKPGAAVELTQRMKAEGVTKGVVITSMDFQESAIRWAKDKPVVLIDGETLLTMND